MRARRGRRARALAALSLALLLATATAASAHHGEPATGEDELGELGAQLDPGASDQVRPSTDTELTPVAKDGGLAGWEQVAGSRWQPDGSIASMVAGSPTPYDLDFYGVGFLKREIAERFGVAPELLQDAAKQNGFAVGAQCRRSDPAQPVAPEQVAGCKRIPVIYRYRENSSGDLVWEESYRGSDATDPGGFVAAVAWLSDDRALAVGGTGTYPRRERELSDERERICVERAEDAEQDALQGSNPESVIGKKGSPGLSWTTGGVKRAVYEAELERCADEARGPEDEISGAGMARAWLFENGVWRELQNKPDPEGGFTGEDGDEIPDQMRALQAIDVSPRPANCGTDPATGKDFSTECAIAGGMRQLWYFADGKFRNGVGPELNGGAAIIYQINFPNGEAAFRFRVRDIRFASNGSQATAVTAGCCSQTRSFSGDVPAMGDVPAILLLGSDNTPYGVWRVRAGDSSGEFNPDSYYAIYVRGEMRLALRTPGGPSSRYEGTREPASRYGGCADPDCAQSERYSTMRLVSADGDTRSFNSTGQQPGTSPDGVPDWAVGVLRSSGQGIAYTTAIGAQRSYASASVTIPPTIGVSLGTYAAQPLSCSEEENKLVPVPIPDPRGTGDGELNGGDLPAGIELGDHALCDADSYQKQNASRTLYALPSYALNAYRVAGEKLSTGPEEVTDAGVGWAVGDHGAIVRGGGVDSAAATAPKATKPKPEQVPRDPFDEKRPEVTNEPGTVPALAPGPRTGEFAFREGQVAGEAGASKIVMSRDGSEGFAFPNYHFDGARWVRCASSFPDPACAGIPASGVRIPLERDSDPTNDDSFEVWGTGGYRYRDGRWTKDPALPNMLPDVLIAPDDGWAVSPVSGTLGQGVAYVGVWHFDGERWGRCTPPAGVKLANFSPPSDCADGERRLSFPAQCAADGAPAPHIATAGKRIYLYATREGGAYPQTASDLCNSAAADSGLRSEGYPVILYLGPGGNWRGGEDPDLSDGYDPTDGGWDPGRYFSGEEGESLVEVEQEPDGPGTPLRDLECLIADTANKPALPKCPNLVSSANFTKGPLAPAFSELNKAVNPNRQDGARYQGWVRSLAVAQDADGTYQGWAIGAFGGYDPETTDAVIMRLDGEREECSAGGTTCWRPWQVPDAANDYLRYRSALTQKGYLFGSPIDPNQQLTLPAEAGDRNAFLLASFATEGGHAASYAQPKVPAIAFDQRSERWEALPTPWTTHPVSGAAGSPISIAADGQGGFWAGVSNRNCCSSAYSLHHYTDRVTEPVLTEAANPSRDAEITAMAAARDGTLWLGNEEGTVYRYDRFAGWSRAIRIPDWDPKTATVRSAVNAIALGPAGEGIAVGAGGRIADLGEQVGLNPAATRPCDPGVPPPCGTNKDLLAAAVAPDGSAIATGENSTILWRPPGEDFRAIAAPRVPRATAFGRVVMPQPDRAYLPGYRGDMVEPGRWTWTEEEMPGSGFEIDAEGHGYVLGDRKLWERTGDAESPWRPIAQTDGGVVAIPAGGGEGVLVGGARGGIATLLRGQLEPVRHPDVYDPVRGDVRELAIAPGYGPGDVEAWALLRSPRCFSCQLPPQSLLHYSSAPGDARLDPARALTALPDAPAPQPGELSFAAFGKQDCNGLANAQFSAKRTCGAADGSNLTNGLINRRIREELAARSPGEAQPQFAIFTGDAVDTPGGRETLGTCTVFCAVYGGPHVKTPVDANFKHARWLEIAAEPLEDAGLPVLGAVGGQDLARNLEDCHGATTDRDYGGCFPLGQAGAEQLALQAGANLPWRAAIARTPAPWTSEQEGGGLRFDPLGSGALSIDGVETSVPATQAGTPPSHTAPFIGGAFANARTESYDLGSGSTHYATDVIDEATDEKLARIVVVDTSMRSLAASDPQQHPIEPGGQIRWLDEMTCFEGSPEDTDGDVRDCTREEGQRAIVVSNTPTYSYGPISPEELHQGDAAVFESILIKNRVDVVVSGGVGWNGRYWALAPGLHTPCPGQGYRSDSQAPSVGQPEVCGAGGGDEAPGAEDLTNALPDEAQEAAGLATRGAIPFVVSSTAGGSFNLRAERGGLASAEAGFWRGYSIVRLDPSGDPRKTIVEQRPILDWVGLQTKEQVLEPRGRIELEGYAREAFGNDRKPRYYDIPDTEAITHRYELLLPDPEEPWRACEASDPECQAYYTKLAKGPRSFDSAAASATGSAQDDSGGASAFASASASDGGEDPCEPYLCLPERVGTIDPTTGEVKGGNGKYPDTFALATLSVGDHVATQPLLFKRSPSFIVNPLRVAPGAPLQSASAGASPTVPNPPQVPKPNIPQSSAPEPPSLPGTPPLSAAQAPEPQPPAPPAPPPPSEQPSPLDLTVSPTALTVATPAAVIQPPTPPVNPAPPSGARREARQRQAATQKSGADGAEGAEERQFDGANSPNAPPGAAFTRHEHSFTAARRGRPEPSFTTLSRADDGSTGPALLYTGGITLFALSLALGWSGVRPTPRRKPPEVPAPAWSRVTMRR